MVRRLWMVAVVAGCGDAPSRAIDAAGDTPVVVDMQAVVDVPTGSCNLGAPFGAAVVVAGGASVPRATISYDELVIYYDGPSNTINRSERGTASAAFLAGTAPPGVISDVFGPSQNQTETILWMHSGQAFLHYMTRASASAAYAGLTNTGITGAHCFASPHGLYWGATGDLYRASLSGASTGTPARIDSLTTAGPEDNPVVSADDQEIAYMRGADLVVARRPLTTSDFANATVQSVGVTPLHPAGFSGDRCRLYLTVTVGSNVGLYVASRP